MSGSGALADVVRDQIAQVDRRVRGGGAIYSDECVEIRRAAEFVEPLVAGLGLGPFLGSLSPGTGKPQLLLRYGAAGGDWVLKVYGRQRPNEAAVQRLWSAAGVATVPVLDSGDEPVSWLLMPFVPGLPPAGGASAEALTAALARRMSAAHAVYRPDVGSALCLADGVGVHLDRVLGVLGRHGYPTGPGWPAAARAAYRQGRHTFLHGDLTPVNLLREPDGGLRFLDTCGYTGPAEFDAARWSARVGGPQRAEAVLRTWTLAEPDLDPDVTVRLLGYELIMEAGVRELTKEERGADWRTPDPTTRLLLDRGHTLVAGAP